MSVVLMVLAMAAPALAQSPVYSNADLGKPIASAARLSAEEAVRVLRGSHSIADLTDYRGLAEGGPTIVVMGASTTPWDWPAAAFEPIPPLDLYYDGNVYPPYGGYGYAPYYATSYFNRPRHSGLGRIMNVAPTQTLRTAPPPPPAASAPRHIVAGSQAAGRRR